MIECGLVALGGAMGATGRYLMGKVPMWDIPYPVNTFVINVIGCFVIGLVIGLGDRFDMADSRAALFMKTGICGGFSTLAALSAESLDMIQNGRFGAALLYCVATLVVCLTATYVGTLMAKLNV
ncbi:MAG: fluoride efflux transporter CrcB [Eubacterium sp.]|nr:fluoride efflux transporter CrcB [Candidatus Colimonas fimequi]